MALTVCSTGSRCWAGQDVSADTQQKPVVTLRVSQEQIDLLRKNGNVSFEVDASASQGYSGTVSGTISVSEPSNPDRVDLVAGDKSKEFFFALAAGQKMSDTQSSEERTFRISTSPANPTNGTLHWAVTLNPSKEYKTSDSPRSVEVRVITGVGK